MRLQRDTCWRQLGQVWTTSLQLSTQKGIKQHPRSHLQTVHKEAEVAQMYEEQVHVLFCSTYSKVHSTAVSNLQIIRVSCALKTVMKTICYQVKDNTAYFSCRINNFCQEKSNFKKTQIISNFELVKCTNNGHKNWSLMTKYLPNQAQNQTDNPCKGARFIVCACQNLSLAVWATCVHRRLTECLHYGQLWLSNHHSGLATLVEGWLAICWLSICRLTIGRLSITLRIARSCRWNNAIKLFSYYVAAKITS